MPDPKGFDWDTPFGNLANDPLAKRNWFFDTAPRSARWYLGQSGNLDPYARDPFSQFIRNRAESAWNRAYVRHQPEQAYQLGPEGTGLGGKNYMGQELGTGLGRDYGLLEMVRDLITRGKTEAQVAAAGGQAQNPMTERETALATAYSDPQAAWELFMDALATGLPTQFYNALNRSQGALREMWEDTMGRTGTGQSFLDFLLQRTARERTSPVPPAPNWR